jgi:hypothetical protein
VWQIIIVDEKEAADAIEQHSRELAAGWRALTTAALKFECNKVSKHRR